MIFVVKNELYLAIFFAVIICFIGVKNPNGVIYCCLVAKNYKLADNCYSF